MPLTDLSSRTDLPDRPDHLDDRMRAREALTNGYVWVLAVATLALAWVCTQAFSGMLTAEHLDTFVVSVALVAISFGGTAIALDQLACVATTHECRDCRRETEKWSVAEVGP